jgi:hypothetical protein
MVFEACPSPLDLKLKLHSLAGHCCRWMDGSNGHKVLEIQHTAHLTCGNAWEIDGLTRATKLSGQWRSYRVCRVGRGIPRNREICDVWSTVATLFVTVASM